MGKIKTRIIGLEDVEKQQKEEQKKKASMKKAMKKKDNKDTEINADVKPETNDKPEMVKSVKAKKPSKTLKVSTKSRGKKYAEAKNMINKNKQYSLSEAVAILKKMNLTKFDQSVELHLNVDETGLKGEVELPFSTGKTVRIAVVDDKLLERLENNKIDFDILITHPSFMPKLAKYAKVLGPRGLMPNPKAGTISPKPEEVVKKFQKGMLRWKAEAKFPLIHQMIGKISSKDEEIVANAKKFIEVVKPKHILKAYIKTTMSPSLRIEVV